ncbi:MAG: sigma-54-dependent Fis family transcriptional regulator [Deltaproteobacteria bacterium]|nr:MAG: sigma-54-dependent Fis family transcriptional regulator [Deltaproteobacteria bacterium]
MSSPAASILVIDDERGIRSLCRDVLGRAGYRVDLAETGADGVARARGGRYDLILSDIRLPDVDGLQVLEQVRAAHPDQTVILITAYPSVDTAVRGMKLGARDYIAKPFTPDELRMVVARALDEDALRRENARLRDELAYRNLIGASPAMVALRDTIDKVSRADASVLITGESGVGKEVVARAIHYRGTRAAGPFVAVNCGALVDNLLESELFGHVRGAFTGADRPKRGLFVAADGGTLFLDEIAELPLPLQPKLLRALQEGEIKPVGGVDPVRVDVRVVAATNRDLGEAVRDGAFREDLFYRLNVIAINVPPLRERVEDIPLLVDAFIDRVAERAGGARVAVTDAAMRWLQSQPWPGNVRELENAIERAVVLASGPVLDVADFDQGAPAAGAPRAGAAGLPADELISLAALERLHIERVLAACGGQKTKAAAILGINRTTLWKKLRAYGME